MPAIDHLMLVRAAELYYEDNKTQDEIGALLRVTRWKVGRLLAQAREQGIVRIEIVHPRARRTSLEHQLIERFGLADAVVVPRIAEGSIDDTQAVPIAAADYLAALRPIPRTLGVSWGRTIDAVAQALPEGWASGVNVVQVNGGLSLNRHGSDAAATAMTIARKAGGTATTLPIPAILERRETRAVIEADRTVAAALQRADSASAYLYSAGVADADSVLVESGYLTKDDVAQLVRKGAVGDVLGRYIDAFGTIVDVGLDARTVGLGLDRLRAARTAIAVISGEAKHRVAHAVVSNGLCTILVTDEHTALSVLKQQHQQLEESA
ncbi:MAG: sugar-binding transcriptional regulator [Actinomycetota bacterium]